MVPVNGPITGVMGVFHVRGIVAQEVLGPVGEPLSRMHSRLVRGDNSLAIYELPARISSVALTFTTWEYAS